MKQILINIIFIVLPIILGAWAFLATTYYLGCKSYERFDRAETDYRFPGTCWVNVEGIYKIKL